MVDIANNLYRKYVNVLSDTPELDEAIGRMAARMFDVRGIDQFRRFFVAIILPISRFGDCIELFAGIWIEIFDEKETDIFYAGRGAHEKTLIKAEEFISVFGYEAPQWQSAYLVIDQDYRRILVVDNQVIPESIKRNLEFLDRNEIHTYWPDLISRYQLDQVILNTPAGPDYDFFSSDKNPSIVFDPDLFPKIRCGQHYKNALLSFARSHELPHPTYNQLMRYRILIECMIQSSSSIVYDEVAQIVYNLPSSAPYR